MNENFIAANFLPKTFWQVKSRVKVHIFHLTCINTEVKVKDKSGIYATYSQFDIRALSIKGHILRGILFLKALT